MKHSNVAIFVPHIGCPNQCSFCNQKSISQTAKQPDADDVLKICGNALEYMGEKARNAEIAFFGGSFTAIEQGYMLSLLKAARQFVGEGKFSGIRISTRPDAIDQEKLMLLKSFGVTAIELGVQSMDDEVLRLNERGHTSADVEKSAQLVKQSGIQLGLQMMTGLYGDTENGSIKTAEKIIALKPSTVRIYPTAVIKHTRLAQLYSSGEYRPQTTQEAVKLCARLLLMFEQAGINVIRLGLHASDGLEGDIIAGAYHPAFRELCEGEIMLGNALEYIEKNSLAKGGCNVFVNEKSISRMAGQHRCNIDKLFALGYNIKIKKDNSLQKYGLYIQAG
ncbi:MAG TPA: radical SAM protein [Ruminococcaceae bacterium]|nr:radical SAM protein [Oscillospiraceae bacterium]